MKYLLQKSLKHLTIYTFIVFALSVPTYFLLVDWIWLKELDENNKILAERIANEFNNAAASEQKLKENIDFWNEIQTVSQITEAKVPLKEDIKSTIRRQNPYFDRESIDRFRVLKTNISINNKNYILTIETNVEETEETVFYIAMVSLLFFLLLVIGFWILNRHYSKKLWQPFQESLQKIKSFELNSQKQIDFPETDTIEFAELNSALKKLLSHNIATFNSQKEFTENASHELQTPLAVLKNKLDLLLQSKDLTEKQYHIAEEMNKALIKSSTINRNLLLLAKIENSQYDRSEILEFDVLLKQCLLEFQEYFEEKKLHLFTEIEPIHEVRGNSGLTEILINNLLKNALRYTQPGGSITLMLSSSNFIIKNTGPQPLNPTLLFNRFSRISAGENGSGLGLAIAQEICKLHNWQLTYDHLQKEHIFQVKF